MANLQRGLEIVKKATDLDGSGQFLEASHFYRESLQYFQIALEEEQNESTRNLISQKMREYSERADELLTKVKPEKPKQIVSAPPQIDWSSLQKAEREKWKDFDSKNSSNEIINELDNAMKRIEEATGEDSRGNYTSALELYQIALDFFVKALEGKSSPEIKSAITEKVTQYITRAEQIKEYLQSKTQLETRMKSKESIKLEVSPSASPFVEEAIRLATEGTRNDEMGKMEIAIVHYQDAVTNFAQAVKNETSVNMKSILKEKMVSYSARAEQLKQYLASGNTVTNPIQFGITPGEKYKPPPVKKHSKKEKKTWKKF